MWLWQCRLPVVPPGKLSILLAVWAVVHCDYTWYENMQLQLGDSFLSVDEPVMGSSCSAGILLQTSSTSTVMLTDCDKRHVCMQRTHPALLCLEVIKLVC